MTVLYSDEKVRALRLLQDGLTPDEVVLKLIKSRSFSLWIAMNIDVEEILDVQRQVQKEAMLQRTVWEVLEERRYKKWIAENQTYNEVHPDLQPGEVFLFNAVDETFEALKWDTKRIGGTAYTSRGIIIPNQRPVFVQKTEYERKRREKTRNDRK